MAQAASLADSLGKHLECAVCLEQYTEPKVLPCLHSFCKRCLERLLPREGVECKISCPTCRSSAEIPQGQIDLLPANFFVNNLLSLVALYEESGTASLECDNCESGDPPVNRCATCSHFLCEFCTQAHRRGRNTSSHNLMSLEEAKRMGSTAVTKPAICKEHDGEVIKLFCLTCEEAVCRDCTIVKHRDHKYTFVKDAFAKGKESLLKILSETKTKATVLKEAVDDVLEMKKNVNSHAELTVQEVVKCFEDLTTCLNTRCSELVSEIGKFQSAKLKSLEIQQETLETALASVQSSLDFTEKALENGSEVEILNMSKQMSSRLQGLNSVNWPLKPGVNEGLTFKAGQHQKLKQDIASLGVVTDVVTSASMSTVTVENGEEGVMYNTLCGQQVKFNIIAKEHSGRRRREGGDIFKVSVNCVDSHRGSLHQYPEVMDLGNGTYKFCVARLQTGCYKLSVQLKDRHVQGSPFTWAVEKWNLEVFPSENSEDQAAINLSEENLTAQYKVQDKVLPSTVQVLPGFFDDNDYGYGEVYGVQSFLGGLPTSHYTMYNSSGFKTSYADPFEAIPTLPPTPHYVADELFHNPSMLEPAVSVAASSNRSLYAVGSVGFKSGKHMWKVQINGQVLEGCSFGIVNTTRSNQNKLLKLGEKWVCCPEQKNITECNSGDIIELYLNFDTKKLMMYNPRTKRSDFWDGIEGEVSPLFCLATNGDKVSLKIP